MPSADVKIKADADVSGLENGFKRAGEAASSLAAAIGKVEAAERKNRAAAGIEAAAYAEQTARMRAHQQAVTQFSGIAGRALIGFGVATVAGLGLSAKAAIDWESAFAGVAKTVSGTPAELQALDASLRNLAKTLPVSHDEIARVAEAAGQLGVATPDIAKFTKTMVELGVSTNLSSDEAATGLAQLGNVMGVLPAQADRAGAALVALGNNGASTEKDILSMAARIGGAGHTIGLTEAQVLGFAAALSNVGINAEEGGSAISQVMTKIAKSVAEGGKSLDGFAQVAGVSTAQFAKSFKTDAAGAITQFITGLGNVQKSGGNTFGVLNDLGLSGIRVQDTLLRASSGAEQFAGAIDLSSQAWKDNTALTNEAGRRFETTASKIAIAKNNIVDFGISLGGAVLPILGDAASKMTTFAKMLSELPGPIKTAAEFLGVAGAAIGIFGGAALLAIPKVIALREALAGMGTKGAAFSRGIGSVGSALAGPWGVALLAGTVALGYFANKQIEARQRVDAMKEAIDQETGALSGNASAVAAKALADAGAIKAARTLGINTNDLTLAVLGNADAQDRVNAALTAVQNNLDAAGHSAEGVGPKMAAFGVAASTVHDALGDTSAALETNRQAWLDLQIATGKVSTSSVAGVDHLTDLQSAATGASDGLTAATSAAAGTGKAIQGIADPAQEAADALKAFHEELKGIFDSTFSVQAATDSYKTSLRDLAKTAKDAKGKTGDFSASQIELRAKLRDVVQSSLDVVGTLKDQGATSAEVAGRTKAMKEEIYKAALAATHSASEARKYTAVLDQIPSDVKTDITNTGKTAAATADTARGAVKAIPTTWETRITALVSGALADIASVANAVARLNGKTITINQVTVQRTIGGRVAMATGGPVPMVPGARRGADSVAAVLTPGEWVMPVAAVQKYGTRMMEAIRHQKYAGGGLVSHAGPSAPAAGGGETSRGAIVQVGTIIATSADEAADKLGDRLDRALFLHSLGA